MPRGGDFCGYTDLQCWRASLLRSTWGSEPINAYPELLLIKSRRAKKRPSGVQTMLSDGNKAAQEAQDFSDACRSQGPGQGHPKS
ncbi:hypothetical protein BHE74_00033508 [Ensete ventricosum]|nr:hypothetical protein BHE74_00033508 [Ensete ventricosum]